MTANSRNAFNYLIFSQNGVGDEQTHYDPLVVPQVAVGSTVESLHSPMDPFKKRPTNLGVTATNGYVAKSLPESSDDSDEGSLPCTPEQDPDREANGSAVGGSNQVLDNDTMELISSFLRDYTGLSRYRWNQSKALSTMKRVVKDLLTKHRYAYNGMVNRLALDNQSDEMGFVTKVAESLFSDGTTNWGRIASLVAFGAAVCQHLKETGREHCVELVSQEISTYLLANQRDWLAKNNSWEGFVEFFRVTDPESTVRNTLMAFVGVAGIGATLAFLIR
ncbi:induced myeloid leukemia cell differentiation protein Mcl-1b [Poeciliopsis prolifica]|uniref:induced myeloid leukemia cell differentiation protein Mcl-1b n=1 Tax=Poeciliopsis prolifica TaxID=188132 RepID=UPI00072D4DED|nr:induced myeloid leukemia cell differentiation protein Mcl-1b [Poeciliopsis prolifica]